MLGDENKVIRTHDSKLYKKLLTTSVCQSHHTECIKLCLVFVDDQYRKRTNKLLLITNSNAVSNYTCSISKLQQQ